MKKITFSIMKTYNDYESIYYIVLYLDYIILYLTKNIIIIEEKILLRKIFDFLYFLNIQNLGHHYIELYNFHKFLINVEYRQYRKYIKLMKIRYSDCIKLPYRKKISVSI